MSNFYLCSGTSGIGVRALEEGQKLNTWFFFVEGVWDARAIPIKKVSAVHRSSPLFTCHYLPHPNRNI